MKRTLAILLTAILVLGAFALPASASDVTTVKLWTHQNLSWNASYERLIEAFEAENPDIRIEYTNFPYDDFEAKIQTSLIAGDVGADVYEVWGGWMLDFVDAGALAETPDAFVAELREDAFAPVLGTLESDGKIYGAPIELNVEYGGIVVNKGLFEEAGIEYPTTWDEVIDIAKQVSVGEGDTIEMRGLEFAQPDNLMANFLSMIRQNGAEYLVDGKFDFNTPEAVAAMQLLVDYIKVDNITNIHSTIDTQDMNGHVFICLDEAFMCTRGPWVLADCLESYSREMGTDLDYIKQPAFVEGVEQKWVAETGWSLCVPKNTNVPEAAWRFVEFVLEPENLLQHNIACAQIPPRASVASSPEYLEQMGFTAPLLDILPLAEFVGPFNTDQFKTYLRMMYASLVTDDGTYADVASALEKLTSDLNANVKMY